MNLISHNHTMNTKYLILITVVIVVSIVISVIYSIPYSSLYIDKLDETYEIGESITFLIKQEGCSISCDGYKIEVFDEDENLVWNIVTVMDGTEPLLIPKTFQSLKDVVTIREYESVTDKTGVYTIKYINKDLEVTQDFTVIPKK